MIKKVFALILIMCSLSLLGCTTVKSERTVSDTNQFYSPFMPRIQVNVNPDFTYLGEINDIQPVQFRNASPTGTLLTSHMYVFVEPDDRNYVKREVVIRVTSIEDGYVSPNLYEDMGNPLDSGVTEIHGESYQYCTVACVNDFAVGPLEGKGYHLSPVYLGKVLGRRLTGGGGGSRRGYCMGTFEIFYLEDLSRLHRELKGCPNATVRARLADFTKMFEENMFRNIQITTPGKEYPSSSGGAGQYPGAHLRRKSERMASEVTGA